MASTYPTCWLTVVGIFFVTVRWRSPLHARKEELDLLTITSDSVPWKISPTEPSSVAMYRTFKDLHRLLQCRNVCIGQGS
ncbi:MAG TPA: hypothetical protein EYO71_06875 [Rhodospirillales bacterium]|nr:hypothetical protein [Rhodospirillales bacterium]